MCRGVGELALAVFEEDLATHDPRVAHDALEEAAELARVGKGLPRVQPGHVRVRRGQVARALETLNGKPEERREPRGEAARTVGRVVDRQKERANVLRFARLKEALLLVERVRHVQRAKAFTDDTPFAPRAREDEDVCVPEAGAIEFPGARGVGDRAYLVRDSRAEGHEGDGTLEPEHMDRRHRLSVPIDEQANGTTEFDGLVVDRAGE